MKRTKTLGNFSLLDALETSSQTYSLDRIIGGDTKKNNNNSIKKFIPIDTRSLSDLAGSFEIPLEHTLEVPLEDLMDSFITKHGSTSFHTLDELLASSLQPDTYQQKKLKSLSDILDGLIDDL